MTNHEQPTRRTLLSLLGGASLLPLAGCNVSSDSLSLPSGSDERRKKPAVNAGGRWRVRRRIRVPQIEQDVGTTRALQTAFAFDDNDLVTISSAGLLVSKTSVSGDVLPLSRDEMEAMLGFALLDYEQLITPDALAFRYAYSEPSLSPPSFEHQVNVTLADDGLLVGVAHTRFADGLGGLMRVTSDITMELLSASDV